MSQVYSGTEEPTTPDQPSVPAEPFFEDPNHPSRWKHRRRMAYMALFSIFSVTVYVLGPWLSDHRIEVLADIIDWFYFTMGSVIGAYMGLATWAARTSRGNRS